MTSVCLSGDERAASENDVQLCIDCIMSPCRMFQACGKFINSNSVTRMASSSSKSPELLARYCDLLLKKSSKNPEEAELEDTLNQVVSGASAHSTKW